MCNKLSHRTVITLLDTNKADTYSRLLHCDACCKSFDMILMSQWLVIAWMVSQPAVSSRMSSTEWQKIFLNSFITTNSPVLSDPPLPCNSPHPLSTTWGVYCPQPSGPTPLEVAPTSRSQILTLSRPSNPVWKYTFSNWCTLPDSDSTGYTHSEFCVIL